MTKEEKAKQLEKEYYKTESGDEYKSYLLISYRLLLLGKLKYELCVDEYLNLLPDYIDNYGDINRIQLNKDNGLWVLQYINEEDYTYMHNTNNKDAIFKCKTIIECCLQMIDYINECELWYI